MNTHKSSSAQGTQSKWSSFTNLASWALLIILFSYVLYQQAPLYYQNFQKRNQQLPSLNLVHMLTGDDFSFPLEGPSLVVFWASNCPPCLLEMGRLKSAVEAGKLPGQRILAINPYEPPAVIHEFLRSSPHPFQFLDDRGALTRVMQVRTTPTFVWLDGGRIHKVTTGVHIIGHFELERFLNYEQDASI